MVKIGRAADLADDDVTLGVALSLQDGAQVGALRRGERRQQRHLAQRLEPPHVPNVLHRPPHVLRGSRDLRFGGVATLPTG